MVSPSIQPNWKYLKKVLNNTSVKIRNLKYQCSDFTTACNAIKMMLLNPDPVHLLNFQLKIYTVSYDSTTLYLPVKSFPFIYCHTFNNFANPNNWKTMLVKIIVVLRRI